MLRCNLAAASSRPKRKRAGAAAQRCRPARSHALTLGTRIELGNSAPQDCTAPVGGTRPCRADVQIKNASHPLRVRAFPKTNRKESLAGCSVDLLRSGMGRPKLPGKAVVPLKSLDLSGAAFAASYVIAQCREPAGKPFRIRRNQITRTIVVAHSPPSPRMPHSFSCSFRTRLIISCLMT